MIAVMWYVYGLLKELSYTLTLKYTVNLTDVQFRLDSEARYKNVGLNAK